MDPRSEFSFCKRCLMCKFPASSCAGDVDPPPVRVILRAFKQACRDQPVDKSAGMTAFKQDQIAEFTERQWALECE